LELAFKKIHHTTHSVAPDKICLTDSDDYAKKIESMAEDLVVRMARLHKRLVALRSSGLSKKEKAKIRTWADQEDNELLHLKVTIRKRKQSYIKTISTHDLIRLANHHPVWKTHYDVYMDQIQKTTLTHEGEHAAVRCTLTPHVLNSLMIFHDAGDGKVLCVNSDRGLQYEDGYLGHASGVKLTLVNGVFSPFHNNMIRMVERIRAQWIFIGDKWGLNDYILWLHFNTQQANENCITPIS
jgi:pterin-4a-carbinolamine dehydratase